VLDGGPGSFHLRSARLKQGLRCLEVRNPVSAIASLLYLSRPYISGLTIVPCTYPALGQSDSRQSCENDYARTTGLRHRMVASQSQNLLLRLQAEDRLQSVTQSGLRLARRTFKRENEWTPLRDSHGGARGLLDSGRGGGASPVLLAEGRLSLLPPSPALFGGGGGGGLF